MSKILHLKLTARIFEHLAAEADAASIPNVELIRRFLSARYANVECVGALGAARRPCEDRSAADLREGDAILWRAIDAYGRIAEALEKVLTTAAGRRQIAAIGADLHILGEGIALLRELLDLVETLSQPGHPRRRAAPLTMPNAANDHGSLD